MHITPVPSVVVNTPYQPPGGKIYPMPAQLSGTDGSLPIRPFNVRSDLLSVSNLVELCFADRLTPDGKALLRKMRSSARNTRFQEWASHMAGRISMPFTGYV